MISLKRTGIFIGLASTILVYQNCSEFGAMKILGDSAASLSRAGVRKAMVIVGSDITATGGIETVYNYGVGRCADDDLPDTLAHAFRTADGNVSLTVSHHPGNYRSVGPDLNSVRHVCSPTYVSKNDADNKNAEYHEWLAAPYTYDGSYVIALMHNEWYPGVVKPNCDGGWVNSITMTLSYDGGATYSHPDNYKVRMPAVAWDDSFSCKSGSLDEAIYGSFLPTGIIDGHDGYLYSFFVVWADPRNVGNTGTCLMRTNTIDQARSWTVWTGSDWKSALNTPRCEPINFNPIGTLPGWLSVKYSTYFNKYVAVLDAGGDAPVRLNYALSDDLLHWSDAIPFAQNVIGPGGEAEYFSLLDPADDSRNFDNVGQDPYIYFTYMNGDLNRDLVRQKIHFAKPVASRLPASAANPTSTAPIFYGTIADGAAITCDQLNPDAIKSLSTETIAWLGSLQPSGLTLHENYLIARQSGYNGAFGHGEHNAWLVADPSRQNTFNAAVSAFSNQPVAPSWSTRIVHNRDRKNAGYLGVFVCGGDSCYQAGQCDAYGRRL